MHTLVVPAPLLQAEGLLTSPARIQKAVRKEQEKEPEPEGADAYCSGLYDTLEGAVAVGQQEATEAPKLACGKQDQSSTSTTLFASSLRCSLTHGRSSSLGSAGRSWSQRREKWVKVVVVAHWEELAADDPPRELWPMRRT
jgi:hypothetical protein